MMVVSSVLLAEPCADTFARFDWLLHAFIDDESRPIMRCVQYPA
jgi:hypothetical protein